MDTNKMKTDDAVTILVRLVNVAQKRGVFALEESYLAFTAIASLSADDSLLKFKQNIKNLDEGKIELKDFEKLTEEKNP
jgi:hypothetical protein